jgi:hypothetical protein
MKKKKLNKETLYAFLINAINEWTKEQKEPTHIQFILGTLERVKMDYYNNLFGTMKTLNDFIELNRGAEIIIPKEGGISIFRDSKIVQRKLNK